MKREKQHRWITFIMLSSFAAVVLTSIYQILSHMAYEYNEHHNF